MSRAEDWSQAGWQAHLPGDRDPGALVEQLGAQTIPALAAESASRRPDRIAVTVDGERVTHGALDAGAAQVSAWLAGRLDPGDRVLIAAGASSGFLRGYLGALRAGAVVVLANPASTAAELGHLAADSGATIAFASPGPARLLAGIADPPLIVPAEDLPPGPGGRPSTGIRARPQDTALLAYTSGTTGRPKGVPLTHRQLVTSIRSAMTAWRWSSDDVLVHSLPLFHQHGLGGVHATLIAGSTAHIRSKFLAADLIQAGQSCGATVLFAVPTIYQALLDAGRQDADVVLPRLRMAVCGSAPLSPALAAQLPGLLGRHPLVRYGTTESGLDIAHLYDAPDARVSGSIGVPLPGVVARIWSGEHEAATGTDGEIQLRGPQIFDGYWHDPEATTAAFTEDGFFRSGDIGAVDASTGHMMIRGRIKELIITGGMNVYPREVETALESHPSIAEAVVTGVPHKHWGEQVTGWVVLRAGSQLDEEQLIAHARGLLAPYKCPKRIFSLAAVPRTSLGKVNRAALAAARDQ
jgi:acyl-CoA synthetase (AMP-forming)/AMP-acid ligase II